MLKCQTGLKIVDSMNGLYDNGPLSKTPAGKGTNHCLPEVALCLVVVIVYLVVVGFVSLQLICICCDCLSSLFRRMDHC